MKLGRLLIELKSAGVDVGTASALSVNVARELKIMTFPDASEPLFLRVVELTKSEQDFANLRILEDLLGGHVAAPVKVVSTDELACGVFPFVEHVRASFDLLSQKCHFSQVTDVLTRLHAGADLFPTGSREFDTSRIFGRLGGEAWSSAFFRYIEVLFQPVMSTKCRYPQHCDFTYVNLGVSRDRTLRVFDWEDFGAIRYAGFDLATFIFSHWAHGGFLEILTGDPAGFASKVHADIGEGVLGRLGFTAAQFTQVFPGHLALFLGLKKDFGDAIMRRLLPVWTQMMRSERWQRVMGGEGV